LKLVLHLSLECSDELLVDASDDQAIDVGTHNQPVVALAYGVDAVLEVVPLETKRHHCAVELGIPIPRSLMKSV
jgi:hypothetical protein